MLYIKAYVWGTKQQVVNMQMFVIGGLNLLNIQNVKQIVTFVMTLVIGISHLGP
jgi:hypothetical protein